MRALRPLAVGLALLLPAARIAASDVAEPESEVKAAFLFKFLSYVDWPEHAFRAPDAPLVIGVLDADEVFRPLQDIVQGRTAQGRRVEARRFTNDDDVSGVHILFVGRDATAALSRLTHRAGVLVVGESPGALDRGAMVNLVRDGEHVRFQVAPDAAEHVGLHISSRMLAVAQHVEKGSR